MQSTQPEHPLTCTPFDNPVARVATLVPWMQQNAPRLDDAAAFPAEEVAALRGIGALALPLPIEQDVAASDLLADQLARILAHIGIGNLSVGRLYEAHINARHLIGRYGSPDQKTACSKDIQDGHLFALWVTDPSKNGLRMSATADGIRLCGQKLFCSGAGYATRALVTAVDENGKSQMLIIALRSGEQVQELASPLQGMRAAVTGAVDFTGCTASANARLGKPGDYLREPDSSAGAWRGSAVALGGLCSLLDEAKSQLQAAGRLDNPHHLQRLGGAMIACETSRLWLRQAARTAEGRSGEPSEIVSYIGLSRIAIESACLDAMRLVQRSLGLSAFRRGNPVERICRDLSTYLRQPAPDDVLTEAASWFVRKPMPELS
jgi:alkylation response protein AidB-like acyl-CoA dehydrogenase